MIDESDSTGRDDTPTPEEFEAAAEETAATTRVGLLGRLVRGVLALLLIAALLLYFIPPWSSYFLRATQQLWRPSGGVHDIPLAPPRQAAPPKLPV